MFRLKLKSTRIKFVNDCLSHLDVSSIVVEVTTMRYSAPYYCKVVTSLHGADCGIRMMNHRRLHDRSEFVRVPLVTRSASKTSGSRSWAARFLAPATWLLKWSVCHRCDLCLTVRNICFHILFPSSLRFEYARFWSSRSGLLLSLLSWGALLACLPPLAKIPGKRYTRVD